VPTAAPAPREFPLAPEEAGTFLAVVAQAVTIESHYDIFRWLNGNVQKLLPHRMLISAWGDFAAGRLALDVTSALPGVRTSRLTDCKAHDLIRWAYERWTSAGREPLLLDAAQAPRHHACACPLHRALREMRSLFIHGLRDARSGDESLYLALDPGSILKGRPHDSFIPVAHLVIMQIDVAFRRVAALPLEAEKRADERGSCLGLSRREAQILDLLRAGSTNAGIAGALAISPYTVKNHVQRIFRKIGANNRTQAAARYNWALQANARHG
jgi:transcriptional regulator EpsA